MSEKITASKFNELYTFIHNTLNTLDYTYSYRPSWKDSNNNTVSDIVPVSQNSTILANNVNDYVLALEEIRGSGYLKSGLQYDDLVSVYNGDLIRELYFNSLLLMDIFP